jgi:hypothetical protein
MTIIVLTNPHLPQNSALFQVKITEQHLRVFTLSRAADAAGHVKH